MSLRVGFVGVGNIGRPMLERVVGAGHDVSFFARRPEVVAAVSASGARTVGSVGELGEVSDVAVVCVYSDRQVEEVCGSPHGLLATMPAESAVVIHTTCSPSTVTALVRAGSARGVQVLDAPFSGRAQDVAEGTITLLAGGPEELLAFVHPVVSAYCDPILRVGTQGDGQRVKLVNNALFGASLGLVVEAERLAADLGLDPRVALEAIARCSGGGYAVTAALAAGSARGLREAAARYIDKDVATAAALAREAGTDLGVLAVAARSEARERDA